MRLYNNHLLPVSVNKRSRYRRQKATITGVALLVTVGALIFIGTAFASRHDRLLGDALNNKDPVEPLGAQAPPTTKATDRTLVVYVSANSDPDYEDNLIHFVREGIHERDGCDYVIAIQEGAELPLLAQPPELPSNARYVYHKNECFDSGTVGWILDTQLADISVYKYIVWLNGSQRGPYLPAYVKRRMHWTEALTDRLRGKVRMVGGTISCGAPDNVPAVPHVQSYLVAVDQIGLKIIRRDSKALKCWSTLKDTVIHSEMGASAAIFMAGYSIDCLMLRYQGVNWRSMDALDCNAGLSPLPEAFNDGISVDPLEVMFVKVKSGLKDANYSYVQKALKYDTWSQHERGLTAADLQANSWAENVLPEVLSIAHNKGHQCFDDSLYVSSDPTELGFILDAPDRKYAAWQHFVTGGLAEGRQYRFTC